MAAAIGTGETVMRRMLLNWGACGLTLLCGEHFCVAQTVTTGTTSPNPTSPPTATAPAVPTGSKAAATGSGKPTGTKSPGGNDSVVRDERDLHRDRRDERHD